MRELGLGQLVLLVQGNNEVGFWNVESSSLRHDGCRRVPADQQTGGGEDQADCQLSDWVTDLTLCLTQQTLLVTASNDGVVNMI